MASCIYYPRYLIVCFFIHIALINCLGSSEYKLKYSSFLTRSSVPSSQSALTISMNGKSTNEIKPFTSLQSSFSVGIDLGTTYSLVSILLPPTIKNEDKIEVKNDRSAHLPIIVPVDSLRMLPSVVSYSKTMDKITVKVGSNTSDSEKTFESSQVFTSVKRVIGRTIKEVRDLLSLSRSSNLINAKSSDMSILSKVNRIYDRKVIESDMACQLTCAAMPQGVISPEEVSAEILKKLLTAAVDYLAMKTTVRKESIIIENAVITVPAYFSNAQRNATIRYVM